METSSAGFLPLPETIRDILLSANHSSTALRQLYEHYKQSDQKFSMPYICRKAGIPSTGYLSDVMSGKRLLNRNYHTSILKVFPLTGVAKKILKVLILFDNEKDSKRKQRLAKRLKILRKSLHINFEPLPVRTPDSFFALEVFCSFGLFRNHPSLANLHGYWGEARHAAVLAAIEQLLTMGWIRQREDGCYDIVKAQVVLNDRGDHEISLFQFMRHALQDASQQLEYWYPKRQESHFESSILSVRRSHYERFLQDIKAQMLEARTELETEDADMVVRFNMQIYPLR